MPLEIVPPGIHIDFIGQRRLAGLISGGLLLAALLAIPLQGVRLGIDFAGGTEIQVHFDPAVVVDEGSLRELVGAVEGIEDPSVVRYGDPEDHEFLIRFRDDGEAGVASAEVPEPTDPSPADGAEGDRIVRLDRILGEAFGGHTIQRVEFVGPRVGAELRNDGIMSLLWASGFILVYIWVRFSLRFSPGAIIAVLHDLSITAGLLVILGFEFDLRILAAMLAILGYSLNDTIIIYDRIRENMELHTTYDLPEVLNQSINQTLSRTVLTSGTTLLVLATLFFLGGEVIRPFALTMILGVVVGTYSSVYIAAPTLLVLERRFG